MTHVLMVAERLTPAIGGVERHITEIVPRLGQQGYTLTLVAPAHLPGLPQEEMIGCSRILRMPYVAANRKRYLQAWWWWLSNRKMLNDINLIHFHDVYALLHLFGPARLLCPTTPIYITYHGSSMAYPIPYRDRLYRWLSERLVKSSITIGDYLVRWFNLDTQAVRYGAVTPPVLGNSQTEFPLSAVYVGRIVPDTSLDIYLKAVHKLKSDYGLQLPLVVCGDGELRLDMEHLANALDLEVEFRGFVPQPEKVVQKASLIFASTYLAILEGMANQKPVFSVYHTPLRYDYLRWMPGAGQAFRLAGNSCELAAQLADTLGKPRNTEEQIRKGYEIAMQHTWERMADTYIEIWNH